MGSSRRIIWVEDYARELWPLMSHLERDGFSIQPYSTYGEALAHVDDLRSADVIVLDLVLPHGPAGEAGLGALHTDDMLGLKLLARMRHEFDIWNPVIVLSVLSSREVTAEAERYGAFVLGKPVRIYELRHAVTTLISPHGRETVAAITGNRRDERWAPAKQVEEDVAESSSSLDIEVAVVTALQEEKEAVRLHFPSGEPCQEGSLSYDLASVECPSGGHMNVALVSQTSMGNVQAAITVGRVISSLRPHFIILTGITGGTPEKDKRLLGDVLVAEQIVGYELGSQTAGTIERRFDVFRPATRLLEAAREVRASDWVMSIRSSRPDGTTGRTIPKVHFGVVASGAKVVRDPALTAELQSSWSKLAGIEMEGLGAAAAAFAEELPGVLLVKGISDWADPEKSDDWRQYAAEAAAVFVVALIKRLYRSDASVWAEAGQRAQVARETRSIFSGQKRLAFRRRLADSWRDLADALDIPTTSQKLFESNPGNEGGLIWEWLEARERLHELPDALRVIDRQDLQEFLEEARPNPS